MLPPVYIKGTTPLDGEQRSGVSFNSSEQLSIARLLRRELLGSRIEIASARVSQGEQEAVRRIAEWAASKGIVNGTDTNTFEPDRPVTREEMAVVMQRYAEKLGYALPKEREAEIFVDDNKITDSMKDAVQAMQQAGVMNGKGGKLFAPKDTATRAEAAAVLRRFVEIVIDRDTAGGWAQNDTGSWLYYENHKPVTGWKQVEGTWYYFDAVGLMQLGGWKQIGGKWYYFYADGSMAANTEIDGYQIGPDGARNS